MANIVIPIIVILSSIALFIQTYSFPVSLGYDTIGPGFWPRLMLGGMIITAGILMIRSLVEMRKNGRSEDTPVSGAFVLVSLFLVAYVFAIQLLGFLPASLLAMIAFIRILGEKSILFILATSFGLVGAIYLIFAKIMITPLPRGVWVFRELSYLLY